MPPRDARPPVRSYLDPRIEVYEPTGASPYYRLVAYDERGRRVVNTTAGRSVRDAEAKAATVARQLRRGNQRRSRDPERILVTSEVEEWLKPQNHRTRHSAPWSSRHAENMEREWRLRISPHLSPRATVDELDNKHLWVRILNAAQASGLAPATVQKTGQACRHLVSWLVDRDLLARNPMAGVSYSVTKASNDGIDPRAVRPQEIPNLEMVYDLAYWMAWIAWPHRPGRGGNRRPDAVSPEGRALQPMLVATTGLRNGELFALRPSRIDLTNLEIEIAEQLIEEDSGAQYIGTPKHGSLRTVTFAGFLEHDVKDLIDHRRAASGEDDPLLFCAAMGGWERRKNHSRRFRNAANRAGWPEHTRWYGLRHLYAVTMLERLPLEIVSRLMGHHSPEFTAKRYLSLRVGWLDRSREVSRMFDPWM